MELIAEGRTAEVFAWDDGRVVKLDRPEWCGLSHYEADVLARMAAAGVAVPAVYETVTVEGRTGVVLERLYGPLLSERLRSRPDDAEALADRFADFHASLHRPIDGLPDYVDLVRANVGRAAMDDSLRAELLGVLTELDDGTRLLCHGDLNADNLILTERGPVAIDWLTAASGPPAADLARALVLLGWPTPPEPYRPFVAHVADAGVARRGLDEDALIAWVRIMAAARLDEGFDGGVADRLVSLARGWFVTPARRAEVSLVLARVSEWAARCADIEGLALVGSWARDEARMDSDVDLVVLTALAERYTEGGDWIEPAVGWGATLVRTQPWGPLTERRLRLPSGLEVEFGFAPPTWAADPLDAGTARIVADGCTILHDPATRLTTSACPRPDHNRFGPPGRTALLFCVPPS